MSIFVHALSTLIPEISFLVSVKYFICMGARITSYAMLRDIEANAGSLKFDAFGFIYSHVMALAPNSLSMKKAKSKTYLKVQTMIKLYGEELRHIREGTYAFPSELRFSMWRTLDFIYLSLEAFNEFYLMDLRRQGRGKKASDALSQKGAKTRFSSEIEYPDYYLQNFHHQSDGWLSSRSARRWEFQVEVRFIGSAGTMRRRALPHIKTFMKSRREEETAVLDLAAGTGQFLDFIRENHPRVQCTAVDLSAHYLEYLHAFHTPIHKKGSLRVVQANAENLPYDDHSFDLVTNVYLFHELPESARVNAAKEIARVLKPGGQFIFVDSAQLNDANHVSRSIGQALNKSLTEFSVNHHEPYHRHYISQSIVELFDRQTDLTHMTTELAFLSKVMVFFKK